MQTTFRGARVPAQGDCTTQRAFGHAANDRQPLVDFPGLIESHADQKYDKIALHLSSHSLFVNHGDPPSLEIEKNQFNRGLDS